MPVRCTDSASRPPNSHASQSPDETPEVTREDQQRINAFGRLNNQLHELQAELEGKKARGAARPPARPPPRAACSLYALASSSRGSHTPLDHAQKLLGNLEEAENELLVSDDQETGYVLGECFVRLPNEEAEARLQKESKAAEKEAARLGTEVGRVKGEMDALKKARRPRVAPRRVLTPLPQLLYGKFGNAINLVRFRLSLRTAQTYSRPVQESD